MQKNKTFLSFKWSLQDSLCIVLSFSLLLCPHIFFVCPTGNELLSLFSHLSSPCCFLALIDRFESLLRLAVFLSSSPSASSSLCSELTEVWQLWITARYSSQSNCDDLMSQQAWLGEMRWWSLHCQSSSQQVLFLFRLVVMTTISMGM